MARVPDRGPTGSLRTLFIAAALPLILASCGGGYGSGGGSGVLLCGGSYGTCPAPTVSVTAPTAGATVSGTSVSLTADAAAAANYGLTISRVDFMVGATLVGTAMTSPYTVSWNSTTIANNSYSVTAKATDSMSGTTTSAPVMITVTNAAAMSATLSPAQIFPAPRSSAAGVAHVTVELESGAIHGTVELRGLTATAVSLNEGFAGANGARVLSLAPGGAAGEFAIPAGASLTAEHVQALMQGRLYVLAASAAYPRGELRAQLAPGHILVSFSALSATPAATVLGVSTGGVAAATLDTSAHTLSVHVNSTGVDDALAAQLSSGRGGVVALAKDGVDMGHWAVELAGLDAAGLASFKAGEWQLSIATGTAADGALHGRLGAD